MKWSHQGGAPFQIELQPRSCDGMTPEEMRATIAELNAMATEIGCVVFPPGRDFENVVVIFAAAGGVHFRALALATALDCEVIYFQDCYSAWYQGSRLLPSVERLVEDFLLARIGARRAIFVGQSSGAYACLVSARRFPGSVTLALSPQSFSDRAAKARLTPIGDIRVYETTDGLIDVADLWKDAPDDRFAAIIFSACEDGNPIESHFWIDHLHVMRLVTIEAFSFFMLRSNSHNILHGRTRGFAALLRDVCSTPRAELQEVLAERLSSLIATSGDERAMSD